jgi:hypothetical protein
MAYNPSAGQNYRLQSSIGSSDTTITLSSFAEPVSGTAYTMSYLNTTIAYGTLDPSTTRSEFISFTGITQNSDGTATLTGVTRGLSKSYPFTTSATYQQAHPGQSIFILSDTPQLFSEYAVKRNDESITGAWTASTPTTASGVATKGYVDSVAMGTTTVDKLVVAAIAGETVASGTLGNLMYLKSSDGRWYRTSANTASTVAGVQLGICQASSITTGVAISGGVLTEGLDVNQSGLAAGTVYYAGNTLGTISSSAGTVSRVIGQAKTATNLYFNTNFAGTNDGTQYYGVDSGSNDTYVVSVGDIAAYSAGMVVNFKANTANTGAATLNVNSLGAKTIKKIVTGTSSDLDDNDITATQIVSVIYNGTDFIMASPTRNKMPVFRLYASVATSKGSSTTQFNVTNTSGSTYRYTFNGTGTDPNINSGTIPIGTAVGIYETALSSGNHGAFITTGVGANYFEVTNPSGVVESNKAISTGFFGTGTVWTKPAGLKYVYVRLVSAGGGGAGATNNGFGSSGGGGGYSEKYIASATLGATESVIVGIGGAAGGGGPGSGLQGSASGFGTYLQATGGKPGAISSGGGNSGGIGSGGDLNANGTGGSNTNGSTTGDCGPSGGSSVFGGGAHGAVGYANGNAGTSYGGGGSGGSSAGGSGTTAGGAGYQGVVSIVEFYS